MIGLDRQVPEVKRVVPCCYGYLMNGSQGCTCWSPIHDSQQSPLIANPAVQIRTEKCDDCAFRSNSMKIKLYEGQLANLVAKIFHCKSIIIESRKVKITFIGISHKAENAEYFFTILLRNLNQDRRAFIKKIPKQTLPKNKIKRAEAFCRGWVLGVARVLNDFSPSPQGELILIDEYVNENYDTLSTIPVKKVPNSLHNSFISGNSTGKNVKLHSGIESTEKQKFLTEMVQNED